jgi:hypothetical protein
VPALTVSEYVLGAIDEWISRDLPESAELDRLTAATDPILADLWDNPRDAAYDRL